MNKFNGQWLNQCLRSLIVSALVLAVSVIPSFAGNKVFFYHTDAAGTPVAMSDASGEVVWRADYMPFGEEHELTGNIENKNRFIGKEKDEETDLYYFGARYLDARTGRFIKPDPVGIREADLLNPQRLNRYSYSLNNPYRYVDPDGREVVLRPEAMQTFHETREQVLGWAPSIVKEIIMPVDPVIGPASSKFGKGKIVKGGRLGNSLHRRKVEERAKQLVDEGHEITAGGQMKPERSVITPEGKRRFPDISSSDPSGKPYHENVGKVTKSGKPVWRERKPLEDIERATGRKTGFTPLD